MVEFIYEKTFRDLGSGFFVKFLFKRIRTGNFRLWWINI